MHKNCFFSCLSKPIPYMKNCTIPTQKAIPVKNNACKSSLPILYTFHHHRTKIKIIIIILNLKLALFHYLHITPIPSSSMSQITRLLSTNNRIGVRQNRSSYREKTNEEKYKPHLVSLMNFRDGTMSYTIDTVFDPVTQLGTITPEEIVRWMKFKAYGDPDAPSTANPIKARANSLMQYKKAISYFMPNKLIKWNVLANPPFGNPTQSAAVNSLIKQVVKKRSKEPRCSSKRCGRIQTR
jgi:hypothetical protein